MTENGKRILCYLFIPLSLIYMELALKFWCFGSVSAKGAVYTTLLSGAFGFALCLACCIGKRFSRVMVSVWLVIAFLIFGTQAVYFRIFKAFLALFSVTKAGGVVADFFDQALIGIWNSLPFLLAIALPLVLWFVFGKRLADCARPKVRHRACLAGLFLVLQLGAVCGIMAKQPGYMSPGYLYSDTLIPSLSQEYFGLVTTTRIDLRELMLTQPEPELAPLLPQMDSDTAQSGTEEAKKSTPAELLPPEGSTDKNVLDIDFDRLISETQDSALREMHGYFQNREATNKNAQTGLFAGKNLIWIVAESFSAEVIDETLTPTLYKLSSEGYTFENFYDPLWGVSTSDGEYVTMTGLLPKYGVWSFSLSSGNYMPFSIANLLNHEGYGSYAFHPHNYSYYDRDKSHPNMGYVWRARGNGLQITDQFPESDVEMVEQSIGSYVNSSPFHVYYLTVSGHMFYTFSGNPMAAKHEAEVQHLPYSESVRAYLACNLELEEALSTLLCELEAAGELENTVIALSTDHYPYALSEQELAELRGAPCADEMELYRNAFILWSADLEEPETVTKPCSALDILPTLCNLFGLPYDSRLLMGRDMFSDAEGLVIFADHSFITPRGRYNAGADTFEPVPGAFASEEEMQQYVRDTLGEVDRMFAYSAEILMQDYYATVFSVPEEE